jgi:hypothetical protein
MDAYRELNQEQEPSARANLNCHPNPLAFRSRANHHYVSAEVGFDPRDQRYGTLRARTPEDKIGDWERFYFVHLGHHDFLLKSFIRDGPYVTTEVLWPGERYGTLRARTRGPGRRDVFY